MIHIHKQNEPASFTTYKQMQGACYDDIPKNVKQELQQSLLAEQHKICAYCMCRISAEKMRIEHFKCQEDYKNLTLDYKNMLACCMGHEGNKQQKHCDVSKKNKDLKYNPSNPIDYEKLKIKYTTNGFISSDDSVFNEQINSVLNLNCSYLVINRKATINRLFAEFDKKAGTIAKSKVESLIKKYSTDTGNGYTEFCGVVLFFLNKKLKQVS